MFEKASRLKLRFDTVLGSITTEDLWDLPLLNIHGECLNDVAKTLNREIKNGEGENFVTKKSSVDDMLELKFGIVKHIIDVKLADIEAVTKATITKQKKERILSIIASKEDEALSNSSEEELKTMLAEL